MLDYLRIYTQSMALIETSQFFFVPASDFGKNVFQRWIICAYRQILNRDVEVFSYVRRNS